MSDQPPDSSTTSNKPKVLIAEDSPVVRRGLQNFLEQWGYQPVECADDYLTRPAKPSLLKARLAAGHRLITQLTTGDAA